MKKTRHVSAREGYDLWAETYDETPNPVVAMDARYTLGVLVPAPGEQILAAGCGTGRHLGPMIRARSNPVGVDFSRGMLSIARLNSLKFPWYTPASSDRYPSRPDASTPCCAR